MNLLNDLITSAIKNASHENGFLNIDIELPSYKTSEAFLFAPKSRLIDTWSPTVEKVILPSYSTVPGNLHISYRFLSNSIELQHNSSKFIDNINCKNDKILKCDFRTNSPGNWAHSLTNHIPLAKLISHVSNLLNFHNIAFVLPKNTPQHCQKAFDFFRVPTIYTNDPDILFEITFKCTPWISLRGIRHLIAEQHMPAYHPNFIKNFPSDKLFLSRKDTRKVKNEKELMIFLSKQGFTKIYTEDFLPSEQIFLFRHARHIVAVHGAGASPILWGNSGEDRKIVELFPPSYIINAWRIIAEQKKWSWVGVRGKLWPSICKHIYSNSDDHRKFAHKDFEVCIESLNDALLEIGII